MNGHRHWVLLRGLGRDQRHWGDFVELFKQQFPNDLVTCLDTCGNGVFVQMNSPLQISHYTEHCRSLLSLGARQVHLVGLSLGGMVAMDWAERYGEEVQSLTLINTSAANLTTMTERIRLASLFRLVKSILFAPQAYRVEHEILSVTSNRPLGKQLVSQWTSYRMEGATTVANLLRQLLAAARFKLGKLEGVPTLVLSSRSDRLVSVKAGTDIAAHLQCPIFYHPDAGHDLPLDDGRWVIEHILSSFGH